MMAGQEVQVLGICHLRSINVDKCHKKPKNKQVLYKQLHSQSRAFRSKDNDSRAARVDLGSANPQTVQYLKCH